ncbi:MAG: cytochrome C oxidase subunit IV family protein [Patescibacteria group bacterium]
MSIRTYITGFGASVLLTAAAFALVFQHTASGHVFPPHELAVSMLVVLALLQLVVQLVCFLHVGRERGPYWHSAALAFALIIVCILVGGTLWIMSNLQQGHVEPDPEYASPQTLDD